jgi:acetylornithine deacetylase
MTIKPFVPVIEKGHLYGRGSCDVKGGMAAMVSALEQLSVLETRHASVVFVASVNEEFGFSGAKAFTNLLRSDDSESSNEGDDTAKELLQKVLAVGFQLVVVAEPTNLHLVTQHKGAVRWRIKVCGRSCHSSHPEKGVNAIYSASRVALLLESLASDLSLRETSHPCGGPTLSVGTIHGGVGVNLVPDSVVLEVDRRLVPGEDPLTARREVMNYISENCPAVIIEHEKPFLASAGLSSEGVGSAEAAARLRKAVTDTGIDAIEAVARYGTNACVYAEAGLPCVVFGPGSIAQAHTADEWVNLGEVEKAAEILRTLVGCTG